MPITVPEFDRIDDDGEKRREFVLWVGKTLGHLVGEARGEYEGVFAPELTEPMSAAWTGMPQEFEALAESVRELDSDQVERHGLGGPQLHFKLATVQYWAQRFFNQRSIPVNWAVRRTLRLLLNAINTLLASLASAVGAGTAVKEIKDAIRDAIGLADDFAE